MWSLVEDRYWLNKLLGEDSFGQVMLATHKSTKTKVAIKKIDKVFDCLYMFKKIIREIQILAQLS